MPPKSPNQHFITKSYMKQWADDSGKVGVVCLHHRGSALVSPKGLHHVRDMSSHELENKWSRYEDQAMQVLGEFKMKITPDASDDELAEAERYLSNPDRLAVLVDFIALHHARSLVVPLQQWIDPTAMGSNAESETAIRERWETVRDHYGRSGIEITVYPEETPVTLGAIPVFDEQDWGVRPPGTARFLMPLTPRMVIGGTPDWSPSQIRVIPGSVDHETLLALLIGCVPGMFNTSYLICEPSALERTTETALRLFEGGNWHWYAICNRINLCGSSAPSALRVDWRQRTIRHVRNQGLLGISTTTSPTKRRLRRSMAEDARKIQHDLDGLNVPICACDRHRSNPEVSALWKATMPQAICDEMRRQRNTHQ